MLSRRLIFENTQIIVLLSLFACIVLPCTIAHSKEVNNKISHSVNVQRIKI